MASKTPVNIMNLPVEMLDNILSYLTYDQIAKARGVNRAFNTICSDKLNKGLILVEKFHSSCLKAVKSKLPRRESERKHHPLARHSEILMAVETRLSMLSMTYLKYIEARHCCFIPGKVLDEALKVLRIVSATNQLLPSKSQQLTLPRPHDFLQEYRDISSMAMEHFDDKILPGIREKMRNENPRLYCYKRPGREYMVRSTFKVPLSRIEKGSIVIGCRAPEMSAMSPTTPDANEGNGGARLARSAGVQTIRGLHPAEVYVKFNCIRKAVLPLSKTVKELKVENTKLKRKLLKQGATIKYILKEIKDLRKVKISSIRHNQLNMEMTSKDLNTTEKPVGKDSIMSMTSSLSFPLKIEPSSSETKDSGRI